MTAYSVAARRSEIGIRRALGATRGHIIAQFLVETTTLSMVGGAVGVAIGLLVCGAIAIAANYFDGVNAPIPTIANAVHDVVVQASAHPNGQIWVLDKKGSPGRTISLNEPSWIL